MSHCFFLNSVLSLGAEFIRSMLGRVWFGWVWPVATSKLFDCPIPHIKGDSVFDVLSILMR